MTRRLDERKHEHDPPRAPARGSVWLVPIVAAGGALAAIVLAAALAPPPQATVAQVHEDIAKILLRKAVHENQSDGGAIGSWWVSADRGNVATGEFEDFQLSSRSIHLAADHARLIVDPDSSTFRFELKDVALMRDTQGGELTAVVFFDNYTLGPAPLQGRIVADAPQINGARSTTD